MARQLTFQPHGTAGGTPLRGVSFRVGPGQTLLVAGPTGSGKSTLLRLIAGLGGLFPDPHAGGRLEVRFGDDPAPAPGSPQIHPHTHPHIQHEQSHQEHPAPALPSPRPTRIVYVPQSPRDALIGLDVFSALAMPLEQRGLAPHETTRRVEKALQRFALLHCAEREVASLSSGEARRVALAGALAQDAPLVLLDEPFADLDPMGATRLLEDLRQIQGKSTLVIAEHRIKKVQDLVDVTLQLLPMVPTDTDAAPDAQYAGSPTGMGPPRWPVPKAPSTHPCEVNAIGVTLQRGGRTILRDVDLNLGPGVWGLLGPNGSGKSSLLWMLAGLLPPASGSVDVAGVPVWLDGKRARPKGRHERSLRRRLQVAFQEPREAFFAATVQEELAAPLQSLDGLRRGDALVRAQALLDEAGWGGLGERSPQRLSGGESRGVQLFGMIGVRPGVWLLDEPTNGLDVSLRDGLRRWITALGEQGHLVLVATHETKTLPSDASWLFLQDDHVVTAQAARPGAPGPQAAGYMAPGLRGNETLGVDERERVVSA